MDATAIGVTLVAIAIGLLIGWLVGSRASAGAKQTVENLRLQLDEVVKERDANRSAVKRPTYRCRRNPARCRDRCPSRRLFDRRLY